MGIKRYEVTDGQWERIAPMVPVRASDPGRTAADNRLFVNAVLWVLRSGARWSDLPERYGKYKSVHERASPAGPRPACGSGCFSRSLATGTTSI
jgi:putative transposase